MQEINGLDEISHRLFTNLEENWEITQSLNELKDLRIQNEMNLKEKLSQLEDLTNELESQKLIDEIQQLKEVMLNNEKIYYEVQQNLARNNEDKATIQENVKDVTCSSYDSNKLAQNCKVLNMEKNELYNINQEIKNEALSLAKQKEEKDNKILKLEHEMQLMKQKLVEKDKLIARNQQTIKILVLTFFYNNPIYFYYHRIHKKQKMNIKKFIKNTLTIEMKLLNQDKAYHSETKHLKITINLEYRHYLATDLH